MERLSILLGLMSLLIARPALGEDSGTYAWIVDGQSLASQLPDAWCCDGAISPCQSQGAGRVDGCSSIQDLTCSTACARRFRVLGGYEFGWLQPRFTENVAAVATWPSGNDAIAFDHSFETTPRVWTAVENSRCTGVRARYWDLRTNAPREVAFATVAPVSLTIVGGSGNLSRTAVANVSEVMTSTHRLEMRTIDLEGTQRIRYSRTETIASFGLRYLKMYQRTHAVATDGTGAVTELVCQDLDFDGFGPTASIEITRTLFCHDSMFRGLSFFADGRGSILFGKQVQEIVLVTGGGAGLAEDVYVHNDFLPTAELVGGLQWQWQPFACGLWSIRTGYRAESWFSAGGPVDSDSNLGLHGMILSIAARW